MKFKTPTLGVILMTRLSTALEASAPNGRILMVVLCLMLSACNGPFAVMPGGELNGAVSEVPESWELDEISALAQLETRPSEPYSINLVYVQMNGQLYIYAGDNRTNWVQHIEQDPRIRIRINETIYPARAVRVTNDDEFQPLPRSGRAGASSSETHWPLTRSGCIALRTPERFAEIV